MKRFLSRLRSVACWLLLPAVFAHAQAPSAETVAVLEKAGVRRGICVVLSDRPAPLAVELARASELLIYVQLPAADRVEAVRKAADQQGLLGKRIFVEQGAWSHLHLADNLADVVVVQDAGPRAPERADDRRSCASCGPEAKRWWARNRSSSRSRRPPTIGAIRTTGRTTIRSRRTSWLEHRI